MWGVVLEEMVNIRVASGVSKLLFCIAVFRIVRLDIRVFWSHLDLDLDLDLTLTTPTPRPNPCPYFRVLARSSQVQPAERWAGE